jgi:hypothetical protein
MFNFRTLSIGTGLAALSASSALAVDQLHQRVSRDAFMRVQYTSKAEFIQGLKHHPKTLKALAKCFGTSASGLLQYIHDNVHLGRLQTTRSYAVWGLHGERVYLTHVRYMAGMPAWVTADGTPVICWSCSNPMMNHLPLVAARPQQLVTPPPPLPPPVVVVPPPPPPAVVVTPPIPDVIVTPPPPVVVVTPPPPVVVVTPPPAVIVTRPAPPMVIEREHRRWLGIKVGALPWTEFFGTNETMATAGVDVDFLSISSTSHVGFYFDTAGEFEAHSPYAWYGGGLEFRQDFSNLSKSTTPYIGVGIGYYTGHVDDVDSENFNEWGGKAFLGLQIRGGPFLELQYNQLGNVNTRNLSRFGLSLGYRF